MTTQQIIEVEPTHGRHFAIPLYGGFWGIVITLMFLLLDADNLTTNQKGQIIVWGGIFFFSCLICGFYLMARSLGHSRFVAASIIIGFCTLCAIVASPQVAEPIIRFILSPLG